MSAMIETATLIEHPDRESWLQTRQTGIGGSDAAAILGYNPWRSPLEVYCDKLGIMDAAEDNEAMEWGRRLEPAIAEKYQEATRRTVTNPGDFTIHRSERYPHMLATVDRLIEGNPAGVLEIKTGAAWKDEDWVLEPPMQYQIQLQHNLIVTGLEWGSFAVLFGGQRFLTYDVKLNAKFADLLIDEEREFWKRIIDRNAPPADGTESSTNAIKSLYPKDDGETVNLPGAAVDWSDSLEEIKGRIKEIMDKKRELENLLKSSIGEATYGILPNGVRYSYKQQTTPEHTVPTTSYRVLRRHSK